MNTIQVGERYGVTLPLLGVPLAEQRDLIAEIADLGYTDLWSAEADGTDAFTPLVLASQWAPELRLGTAIVPAFTRGPLTMAQSSATLANLSGGRFVLGLGTSSDVIVERWNGVPFDRPYQRVRDMVRCAPAGDCISKRQEDDRLPKLTLQPWHGPCSWGGGGTDDRSAGRRSCLSNVP